MSESLTDLGVVAAVDAIRRGETTSRALVEACLGRIEATDGSLGAWVTVDRQGALAAASALDADLAAGRAHGPLHGVPLGIKDVIDVAGLPTTAGAAAFAHTHPLADAPLVARLREAGAVILGKTVATQFAFKDPAATLNPWSAAHTPGGSSSGSAAAVAARQVPAAIGTQTVGSILRPAAFCGVVGLKGAFGAVPLEGVFPLAASFDHIGPLARSVADAALVEAVLKGHAIGVWGTGAPRLGVAAELLDLAEPDLRAHLEAIIGRFRAAGATVVDVSRLPDLQGLVAAGWTILEAEAAAVHRETFATHRTEYGPAIAGLVTAGLGRTAAEVAAAHATRSAFRDQMVPILASVDALLSPVAGGPAPLRGVGTGDPTLCAPWSFTGLPAISIPSGLAGDGLPFALQLVAGSDGLPGLLGAAAWCETLLVFGRRPLDPPSS